MSNTFHEAKQLYNHIHHNQSNLSSNLRSIDNDLNTLVPRTHRHGSPVSLIHRINQELNVINANHVKVPRNKVEQLKYDRISLLNMVTKQLDNHYIILSNWSLNDIYDSNNDLLTNNKLKVWKTKGCKVYGKSVRHGLEHDNNNGYFASFNFPINIIKNPDVYFFSKQELNTFYHTVGNNNPRLSKYLVKMAQDGTLKVGQFKAIFGLTIRQIRASIKKQQQQEMSNVNYHTNNLEKYYDSLLNYLSNNDDKTAYDHSGYLTSDSDNLVSQNVIPSDYHYSDSDSDDFGYGYDDTISDQDFN